MKLTLTHIKQTPIMRFRTCLLSCFIFLAFVSHRAWAQPVVNLGPDLAACSPITLDAGNVGASFNWSTGDMTQTLVVSTTGVYWVDVTDGSGTTRDSINVEILPPPAVLNLSPQDLCGPQTVRLNPDSLGDFVLWFRDSLTGGIIDVQSPEVQVNSDTAFFGKNFISRPAGTVGIENNTIYVSGGAQSIQSGYAFDALSDLVIDSVAVYVNNTASMQIQLWDAQNNVISERSVTALSPNKYFIPLSLPVPAGNDYKLMLVSISGGVYFRNGNAPYPYPFEIPGLISITRHTTNGNNNVTTFSSLFYDWHISQPVCESPWFVQEYSVLDIPVLNLPADTIVCGVDSIQLTAGNNPGATYNWSNGDTGESIFVNASGTYAVDAFFVGQCTVTDSIEVILPPDPLPPSFAPQSLCGPQQVVVDPDSVNDLLVWYTDSMGENILDTRRFVADVQGDTSFYVRSFSTVNGGRVGLENDTLFASAGFVNIQTGYAFDAQKDLLIDSVAVYVNKATNLQVQLWDSSNAVLQQRNLFVANTGKEFIDLGLFVPRGNNYKLMLTSIAPGVAFRNSGTGVNYPFELPGTLAITRHTTNGNNAVGSVTSVFYDWHISLPACESPLQALSFDVVDIPLVDLASDTVVCGQTSIQLVGGNNPGATYNWSNGASGETITVDSTATYGVSAFFVPQCPVTDSIRVFFPGDPQDLNFGVDSLCGPQVVEVDPDSIDELLLWFTDSLGENILDTRRFMADVQGDTSFYVKAFTTVDAGRVGLENDSLFASAGFVNIRTGYAFDASRDLIIDSVAVYVNRATDLLIQLWDSNNVVVQERNINVPNTGKEFIDLSLFVRKGNDYKLMLISSAPGVVFRNSGTGVTYPFEIPGVISITRHTTNGNNTVGSVTSVFYDWHISRPACESPLEELTFDVVEVPTLSLSDDTLTCGLANLQLVSGNNPGATYSWSNGAQTEATTVDSSGVYTVTSFFVPQCPVVDSISVFLLDEVMPLADTLREICTFGEITVQPNTNSDVVLWLEDSASLMPFATQSFDLNVDTSSLGFFSRTLNAGFIGTVGIPESNIYVPGGFANIVSGNTFDALEDLIIDSVALYVNNPTMITVQLWDANNVPIQERVVEAPRIGLNFLDLFFYVPAGTDYKLMIVNLTAPGFAFRNGNDVYPYPFEIKDLISIRNHTTNGTNVVPNFSSYIYNWHISKVACISEPRPYDIKVVIPVEFELDPYSCESFTLATGLPNLQHQWSLITGPGQDSLVSNADTLFIPESGDYIVNITDGQNCVFEDTVFAEIPRTAGLPNDGVLCGQILRTNYGEEAQFIWSTGDTTPTLAISMADTFSVTVFEPRGCVLTDTIIVTAFDSFPEINLGDDFASCVSATLDAGFPNATYNWSNGDSTQVVEVFSSGVYSVEVVNVNGCAGSDTIGILINPAPIAQFSPSINGFDVFFINQSTFGSYQWDFGDGMTSNLVAPFHVYQDTGIFTVRLITTNECGSDTLEQEIRIVDPNVSIEGLTDIPFRLYPNPTTGNIFVQWERSMERAQVLLFNLQGKIVFSQEFQPLAGQKNNIKLGELAPGVYLLNLRLPDGKISYRQRLMIVK